MIFVFKVEGGKENESDLPKFKFINRDKSDTVKAYLKETIDLIKKSKNVIYFLFLSYLTSLQK
jgi:hypothetical protein